jgi:hypothetical protein
MATTVTKINDIEYEVEFELSNADDQKLSFTKSAIRGMTLIDSIFNPFMTGTISIANPYDFLENEYMFRGDGRDKFKLSFKPKSGKDDEKIERTFYVLDDADEVNLSVRSENIKTLILAEDSSLPFVDNIPFAKKYTGLVGDILKEIFIELLGEDSVDQDNWESGDFYYDVAPPLSYRYIDLIYTLMQVYYAKDGDLHVKGLILFDPVKKKYTLQLISKIFEDNKKNLQEGFALGDLSEKIETANPNNPPAEAETGEYIGPMKNLGYSTPLFGWNSDFFINYLVFGYDKLLGVHNIRKLSIDDLKEKWKTKFVDVFKSVGGKPKPFLVSNKRTKDKFKNYKLPYPIGDSVKLVESEIYNALTFYNLQATFTNIGDTRRSMGKFIDIFKTKDQTFKSDEKILGRWLVTQVKHTFFGDLYQNELTCCKTYVGPESKINMEAD